MTEQERGRETIRRCGGSLTEKFTIFDNSHIENPLLTWEARGLLHYLLHLPVGWRLYLDDLSDRSPAGETKNRRILKELQGFGHIHRIAQRGADGRFEPVVWEVWEIPFGWDTEA